MKGFMLQFGKVRTYICLLRHVYLARNDVTKAYAHQLTWLDVPFWPVAAAAAQEGHVICVKL